MLTAIERTPDVAIIHYNLACYECQLEDLEAARARLEQATKLEKNFGRLALEDEDLRPLGDAL